MRLTSELFVSALIRRVNGAGAFAVLAQKGAPEAGAVFVKTRKPDGLYDLFAPAPQTSYEEDRPDERVFQSVESGVAETDVDARLAREKRWDPDLWVVEIEDFNQPVETLVRIVAP
jgi:hypothetical protein